MSVSLTFTTLGELIKEKRTELSISLSEVSRVTGISKGVLSKIENDETKRPELRTLKPIADVLAIPYEEIIERYIDVEHRIEFLDSLLSEAIEMRNLFLIAKLAKKILENPQEDTYTSLERLYDLAGNTIRNEVKLKLYSVIIEYARVRGEPKYIVKGLLQKYLIERKDLKKMEDSFSLGQEIIHYKRFLTEEEKAIFYFRMALQAFAIKKYHESIELAEAGLNEDKSSNELKARAYLAMINSLLLLGKYDEVEHRLDVFENFEYNFVPDATKITRGIVKAKKKEHDVAIPMLKECLDEVSKELKIHVANELFDVYFQTRDMNSIAELLTLEQECIISNPQTPFQFISMGIFYQYKGNFMMETGFPEQGKECYLLSLSSFGKVSAYQEMLICMKDVFSHFTKKSMSFDLEYIKQLDEVYNNITKINCN
ncbi:helix-turn-helix domain-containing protein [Brevibacillus laterosporus]|uniref:helix-turn-helix domain-containing protein n=1 Tax=Brevibacillus laterosporus TaxID=1465 RepID=UPI000CE2C5A1|nr:helix-turn-helix domain-containing protein [Brevibacillus laterosporus]MBG9774600.1 DNA-binding protein [Brevibacillus laterosporus]MBG9796640.1 DNA-binding protein [Brevibacillus laterosporus]MCR8935792.1 helix-turn-helix domain-containing protein [Brevibacillus laterosporus]MCZ0838431.1 helix-turn-helix domain-containing protein [Brevibacillus laterosporus]MCZ0844496.1 helix-turn-helix domain-containing protein [Brevibacillus laterosporus]